MGGYILLHNLTWPRPQSRLRKQLFAPRRRRRSGDRQVRPSHTRIGLLFVFPMMHQGKQCTLFFLLEAWVLLVDPEPEPRLSA